ncbi:MAG: CHAT domain-containing protein [Dermatophilaceae bacterium]
MSPPRADTDQSRPRLDVVEEDVAQAKTQIAQYRPDLAAALLRHARTLADAGPELFDGPRGREALMRVTLAESWVAFEERGLRAGERVLQDAVEQAQAMGRLDLVSLCHMQGASMHGRSGNLAESLARMNRASEGQHALALDDRAKLLLNRGVLEAQLMQLDHAVTDLTRSAQLANGADEPDLEFAAVHNLGYVEYLRGDLPVALALMDQADAMTVDVERGVSLLDRSRVLLEAGLVTEARDTLREAITAGSHWNDQDLGEIELVQARTALLLGDAAEASRLARTARRRFHGRASSAWRRQAQLVGVEATHAAGTSPRSVARVAAALHRAALAHDETHLAKRSALVAADALLDQGELGRARTAYLAARPLAQSSGLATRQHVALVAARVAVGEGARRRAAAILRRAAEDLALAQQRASSLDLRTALAVHSGRLAALDLRLGMESGQAASVFARTERWRAVSARLPVVQPPPDSQAAGLLSRLRRTREDLRSVPPGPDADRLREEVSRLERRIRRLDWARTSNEGTLGTRTRPIGYADALAAARAQDTTIVSYLPFDGSLYAVVLDPQTGGRLVRLTALGAVNAVTNKVRADLEVACLPTVPALRGAVEASLRGSLDELDRLLLRPLGSVGRVAIVPMLGLAGVPWGMLPSREGLATTLTKTVTGWARTDDPTAYRPRVAALAGPDLPMAATEVRQIGQAWPGATVVEPQDCTTQALVRVAATHDVVHIAAHGRHNYESPLFSTLRFADGPAFGYEVPGKAIAASHVVLSACEVGRVTMRSGDEALGLTSVLLSLGIRSVVAAVARVPDDVAAHTMVDYHRELARGTEVAEALASATRHAPLIARAFMSFGSRWRADPADGTSGRTTSSHETNPPPGWRD